MIRRARPTDGFALRTLAQLADRPAPTGDVILAESDGELIAAVSADGGSMVADPFVVTGDVVELLEVRARQLLAAA